MGRYRLLLEYDGTAFTGWQSQPGGTGVQDAVEKAILSVDGGLRRLSVAGRTDTGVHATGQVAHVDLEKDWRPFRLKEALNAWLRDLGPVAVLDVEAVGPEFEARFGAIWRSYLYRIALRRGPLTLDVRRAWSVSVALDLDAMQAGAAHLVGTHDFSTFRNAHCQAKSPVRTLDRFDLEAVETPTGPEIHCHLKARSFLHNQVRSMVGTLVDVGRGARTADWVAEALAARDRARCGQVAPAWGLYLTGVGYGEPVAAGPGDSPLAAISRSQDV
jgi:tRNA pseudouridine38-40 synthase